MENTGKQGTSTRERLQNFFVKAKDATWWTDLNPVLAHLYAAKWFLSTIGSSDKTCGYSMSAEYMQPADGRQTIISNVPIQGELDGLDGALSSIAQEQQAIKAEH